MGMTLTVRCPAGVPAWPAVAGWLMTRGLPPQMRMIDGQLAFPDEEPPEDWRELRVSLSGGMLAMRRESAAVLVVTWGNADDALRRAWHALALAFAEVAGGTVISEIGELSAAEFRARAELPAGIGQ